MVRPELHGEFEDIWKEVADDLEDKEEGARSYALGEYCAASTE